MGLYLNPTVGAIVLSEEVEALERKRNGFRWTLLQQHTATAGRM